MTTRILQTTADDCWGDKDGNFNNTSDSMFVGGTTVSGSDPRNWIPFSIPLAKNKTITSATLVVYATGTNSTSVDVRIGFEAADNPAAPTTAANLRTRVMTTAYTDFTLASYTAGDAYTYDVTAALQEIVNRSGWVAGNTAAVLVFDLVQGNTNRRQWATFEHATYVEPRILLVFDSVLPMSGGIF